MSLATAEAWLAGFTGDKAEDVLRSLYARHAGADGDNVREARVDEDPRVVRIRAGDIPTFTDVYVAFADRLATYARGYVRDAGIAEDVVQEVMTVLWDRRSRLQVRGSLTAYLYGAIRRAALNAVRDAKVRERYLSAAASEDGARVSDAPDTDDPERIREWRRSAVLHAANELPERCREVFLLRWRDGLAYAEIAAVMGIALKTVEMQMTIAVKRLRARLGGGER